MRPGRLRVIVLGLLVAAAVVSVFARKGDSGWLTALTFSLFAAAVAVFFRWRQQLRAIVLDPEEKTRE